jgi:hypothetical protein
LLAGVEDEGELLGLSAAKDAGVPEVEGVVDGWASGEAAGELLGLAL